MSRNSQAFIRYQLWKVGALIALAFVVCAPLTAGGKRSSAKDSDFDRAVKQILKVVEKGDQKAFLPLASKHKVLVVSRHWDLGRSGSDTPFKKEDDIGLSLEGLEGVMWVEREVEFRREELKGKEFAKLLKEFGSLILNTQKRYPYDGVKWSLNMADAWYSRQLGPAVEGNTGSSDYWYIYLVHESNGWKVWRLEEAHH